MKYGKLYHKDFEWKYEAQNFLAKFKKALKKNHWRAEIKLVPITHFSSSTAQHWNLYNKLVGSKEAETKIAGYRVRWNYLPPRRSR